MRVSFCLIEPADAFLVLANIFLPFSNCNLLSLWKSVFFIKISPLISINFGKGLTKLIGMSFIVLMFSVTISPTVPSPLVTAFTKDPSR